MPVVYGLFELSYDYYEWKDLIAVSEDKQKLVDLFNMRTHYYPLVYYFGDTPTKYDGDQHAVIQPVQQA